MTHPVKQTMHIGELSERTGLSLRTIRHYGDIGLLPATQRTDGGFRVYSESDYAKVLGIRHLKFLGLSLEEITEVVDCSTGANASQISQSRALVEDARNRLESMRGQLAEAEAYLDDLERQTAQNEQKTATL